MCVCVLKVSEVESFLWLKASKGLIRDLRKNGTKENNARKMNSNNSFWK